MQKLIPALLFPVFALFLSNDSAFLFGKITDATGAPLPGVSLILSSSDTIIFTTTDTNGLYRIQLPNGDYQLRTVFNGWKPYSVPVISISGRDLEYNFSIEEETSALSEVEIVAPKAPPIQQDHLSRAMTGSSAKPASPRSHRQPEKAAIKGSRSNATNYYIDGVRVGSATPAVSYNMATTGRIGGEMPADGKKERRYDNGSPKDSIAPEPISGEQYNTIVENPFVQTTAQAFSTFSIDVDAASYSNMRRYINYRQHPPADAIRIEEMVNYFDYNYPPPTGSDPIRIVTELGKCPWNTEHHLLMVGLQGRHIDAAQAPPSNLVFLVDVSGSMANENKLPLVKKSLHLLLDELRPTDRVSIVTYAGSTEVVLPGTPASDKTAIKAAIEKLNAGGSTAGASGIVLAYETARKNFFEQGNNRVILCTDGDFNVGLSSEKELVNLIEKERKSGVYLTVLGFGTGNYQDGKMQELADRGNGNHAYIDQISEAKKVLVKEFTGTLFTIAKDVKLQLEFNPNQVSAYRLVGYENRMLAKEDFDNDAKDAGELGAGHTVTALYEIIPNVQSNQAGDLVQLKFRYKPPVGDQPSQLVQQSVPAVCAAKISDNFNFASAVAEFGLLMRNSSFKGNASFDRILANAKVGLTHDKEGYRTEFVELVKLAKTNSGK